MSAPDPARPEPVSAPPAGADSEVGPPPDEDLVWGTLARWRAERRRFALLTVVAARGSTPRKPGAHMLLSEAGERVGSLGGGAIELLALEQAREALERGRSVLFTRQLAQELGMCCGGEMSVFIETVEVKPRLFVFGAGYIARPLAGMATACGFAVTVVDGRPEWAAPERFPGATVLCQDAEDAARALELTPGDYVCVVTHDHALDHRIVQVLLKRPLRFLGMIGSRAKQRTFLRRLLGHGFAPGEVGRLRTPLGLSIGATTPEEIAVSVLAQLIAERRGVAVEPGWEHGAAADESESAGESSPEGAGGAAAAPGEVERP